MRISKLTLVQRHLVFTSCNKDNKFISEQECISVECGLPAAVAISLGGGGCLIGGGSVCLGGVSARGVSTQGRVST